MSGRRRIAAGVLALLGAALLAAGPVGASARPSLAVIERQVMCVTCKIPLNVAESPQADRERAFIQSLIDGGQSEQQIKAALVSQYGPTVLGLPGTSGFGLAAYLVPVAVVLGMLALLAVLLPRWRRQTQHLIGQGLEAPKLAARDAARLESDLARFD